VNDAFRVEEVHCFAKLFENYASVIEALFYIRDRFMLLDNPFEEVAPLEELQDQVYVLTVLIAIV
jgi:hypothetical protein